MASSHRILSFAFILLAFAPLSSRAGAPDQATLERGAAAYARYCVSCHGVEGDGRGIAAEGLDPRPRDFTDGRYKFRTTPPTELPTDADILRTLDRGLHHTSMPNWKGVSQRELRQIVAYLKTLSPRFGKEAQGTPIRVPPRPDLTPALVAKGKEVWAKAQCATCHGDAGKGNGPVAKALRDAWGDPVLPRDLTSGPIKAGAAPEDIYVAVMAGLAGSPMPSFASSLSPEEAWALVAYVKSLRKM